MKTLTTKEFDQEIIKLIKSQIEDIKSQKKEIARSQGCSLREITNYQKQLEARLKAIQGK